MEKAGKKSRIGEENRQVQARNAERAKREQQFKVVSLEAEREKRRLLDAQRRAAQEEFARAGAKPPPSAREAFDDAARAPEAEPSPDHSPPRAAEPVPVREAFEEAGRHPDAEDREPDEPDIWDRDAYERERADKLIEAAIAEAEEAERRAQEEARRQRFEEWAARERQKLFGRQLEARDALHHDHERRREVWANRVGEPHDRWRERTNAQIRAIEERQAQPGLKGWLYRVSGRAEADREELDLLRERRQTRARELEASREAMEAPLRAADAALNERQEAELRELDRHLAEKWEQSWNRAGRQTNDNRREREEDGRGQDTPRERGDGGGRMRVRGYD